MIDLSFPVRLAMIVVFAGCLAISARADQEANTDRPGGDYKTFEMTAPLPGRCRQACNKDRRCRAWSFAWPGQKKPRAVCSLKSTAPEKIADNCCISGLADDHHDATPQTAPAPDKTPKQTDADTTANAAAADHDAAAADTNGDDTAAGDTDATAPDPDAACKRYAERARRDATANRQRRCGLTGNRWRLAYAYHFSWCKARSRDQRIAETRRRQHELAACPRSDQPQAEVCQTYASAANAQVARNRSLGCGFTGELWNASPRYHQRWCAGVDFAAREQASQTRSRLLAVCASRPRKVRACARYARRALAQIATARRSRCRFSSRNRLWINDYDRQFTACMGMSRKRYLASQAARQAALARCGGGAVRSRRDGGIFAPRRGGYVYRWVGLDGARIRTRFRRAPGGRAVCVLRGPGCACFGRNFCGAYFNGEIARWWGRGCVGRPARILCQVIER